MILSLQRKLLLSPYSNCSRIILMGSKNLLKSPATPAAACAHIFAPFLSSYWQTHFPAVHHKTSGYSYTSSADGPIPRPITRVDSESPDKQLVDEKQLMMSRQKLQENGIDGNSCLPGQYITLICPSCKGGNSREKSLSVHITADGRAGVWTCFRAKCRWKGTTRVFAGVKSTYARMNRIAKIKQPARVITEESLGLKPLCNELLAYFAERMISGETLQRNSVMQKRKGDQIAIAFTYRRNGELVNCKYRDSSTKRFWGEANTERIFYGRDDIKEATDIIIVEGEMDKLAMEEAGFKNCVSVPNGAPGKVSNKALPSVEEDTGFQYLWNCKDYLDKASRIILATDGDLPGQALAEELARRLGKKRCWQVHWPKKDEVSSFKDSNEVLMNLGAEALRDAIDKAELYQMQSCGVF